MGHLNGIAESDALYRKTNVIQKVKNLKWEFEDGSHSSSMRSYLDKVSNIRLNLPLSEHAEKNFIMALPPVLIFWMYTSRMVVP